MIWCIDLISCNWEKLFNIYLVFYIENNVVYKDILLPFFNWMTFSFFFFLTELLRLAYTMVSSTPGLGGKDQSFTMKDNIRYRFFEAAF